ncbi:MAG: dephospho-CoA kinase [Paludibacteraceae bacterium]|jgi:dephospho-CoA kinase|nr:dephospho-CoA kinase [Paludibacteraceae bacterium]
MKHIGITGGIGSGKSVVSEVFSRMGIPAYNADNASKLLISTRKDLITALKKILGSDIYVHGSLDKKKMAQLIFNDKELLTRVNSIIHPAVIEDFKIWSESQMATSVACETAILFESGMDKLVDIKITVTAPLETRIRRCVTRDGLTEEQIRARINNQMDDEERIRRSDFVIINDEKHAIIPQIKEIINTLA